MIEGSAQVFELPFRSRAFSGLAEEEGGLGGAAGRAGKAEVGVDPVELEGLLWVEEPPLELGLKFAKGATEGTQWVGGTDEGVLSSEGEEPVPDEGSADSVLKRLGGFEFPSDEEGRPSVLALSGNGAPLPEFLSDERAEVVVVPELVDPLAEGLKVFAAKFNGFALRGTASFFASGAMALPASPGGI
jgi:hypothetical protein